jgi:hypothetical protein
MGAEKRRVEEKNRLVSVTWRRDEKRRGEEVTTTSHVVSSSTACLGLTVGQMVPNN